jgi:hypothetical protein
LALRAAKLWGVSLVLHFIRVCLQHWSVAATGEEEYDIVGEGFVLQVQLAC